MSLKNSMVGKLPNIKITSTADVNDTTVTSEASINNLGIESSPNINRSIHPSTGETTDHRQLDHLDFESSGHTGFASSKDLQSVVAAAASSASGQFDKDALKQLKSNFSTKIDRDGVLLSLCARAGKNWTYASAIDPQTGNMEILTLDTETGLYSVQTRNPARDELNAHIQNQDVHVRAGERENWNEKITAKVDVENQQLILER